MLATPHRLLLVCVIVGALGSAASAVTIATVPAGSPGNAPDPATGSLYGAVSYNYRIGTYDVTNAQYVEFLNAKASAADPFGLWNTQMAPGNLEGAISRSGSGPYSYAVSPALANKPVAATWFDAVRFVNWLTNGQGNGDTEAGTYVITNWNNNFGTVQVPDVTTRMNWANTNALHWLMPSESEWYKAAYYNALKGTYYTYPFQSNSLPAALHPPGNANSGNFDEINFANGSYFTDVGAYPQSVSPFGLFDMGGNIGQWTDALDVSGLPIWRGGDFGRYAGPGASLSAAVSRFLLSPVGFNGFRVASVGSVPEPGSIVLASLGVVGLLIFSKRLRAGVCSFRRASPR